MSLRVGFVGSGGNQLSGPTGVTFDPTTKTLYVVDNANHRIMGYAAGASAGWVAAGRNNSAGNNNSLLLAPSRAHFDSVTNSLIIANTGSHNVVRWTLGDTTWSLLAGNITGASGISSTLFRSPIGITLDPMGNLYVSDVANHRIQFFQSGQTAGQTIAGVLGVASGDASHLYYPYAVALDSQLNVYVADTYNQRIQKFQRY